MMQAPLPAAEAQTLPGWEQKLLLRGFISSCKTEVHVQQGECVDAPDPGLQEYGSQGQDDQRSISLKGLLC